VSPVRYEVGFYIPEDDVLHSHSCENLKCDIFSHLSTCIAIGVLALQVLSHAAKTKI
jgi:hypothetical protein